MTGRVCLLLACSVLLVLLEVQRAQAFPLEEGHAVPENEDDSRMGTLSRILRNLMVGEYTIFIIHQKMPPHYNAFPTTDKC